MSTPFDKVIQAKESNISKLEGDIIYTFDLMEYKYNLNMPGILLDTNADLIKGDISRVEAPWVQYSQDIKNEAKKRLGEI